MLAALKISISESSTIDLALNLLVHRYVAKLASQAGLGPALVQKLFLIYLRYGIDIRDIAALFSGPEHLIEFA